MATCSWNFTTRATCTVLQVDTPTLDTDWLMQPHISCGWLPAPSQPTFYLPPVSCRRVSDGDLFLAASPSLAPFSVAGRDGWRGIEKWAYRLCLHRGPYIMDSLLISKPSKKANSCKTDKMEWGCRAGNGGCESFSHTHTHTHCIISISVCCLDSNWPVISFWQGAVYLYF